MSSPADPPPAPPPRDDSPFQSVFSDVTMDDDETNSSTSQHDRGTGGLNSSNNTILEYSDDTGSEENKNNNNDNNNGQQQHSNNRRHHRHHGRGKNHKEGPQSQFRYDERPGSARGVRFSSDEDSPDHRIRGMVADEENQKQQGSRKAAPRHHRHHQRSSHPLKNNDSQAAGGGGGGGSDENVAPPERRPNWVKRWAYSFRSPMVNTKHGTTDISSSNNNSNSVPPTAEHRRQGSATMEEYPHHISEELQQQQQQQQQARQQRNVSFSGHLPPPPAYDPWNPYLPDPAVQESSPLLGQSYSGHALTSVYDAPPSLPTSDDRNATALVAAAPKKEKKLSPVIASIFLQDYEASRPPSFGSANLAHISVRQVSVYRWKHSVGAQVIRFLATMAFFISSFLEGLVPDVTPDHPYYNHRYRVTILNLFAITIFAIDIHMRNMLRFDPVHQRAEFSLTESDMEQRRKHHVRISRSERLVLPLILFCVIIGLENLARLFLVSGDIVLFSSIFKPMVLFYVSSQARDALAAVRRILKIVARVLVMEMLLILMFAAVACRLFPEYDNFHDLYRAWLSLFELSTTVVNPSIWMPMYQESKLSALFFIAFIVTSVFYLHSLVLSVVFQTYIQAATEIHERYASDREDAVHLAFTALLQDQKPNDGTKNKEINDSLLVDVEAVRETLKLVRPHYGSMKINALVEIVDPSNQGAVDYATFRTKIRQALNASIRTARSASVLAMVIELIAVVVAISNFIYVILLSSPFDALWFDVAHMKVVCVITMFAAFEVLIRFNPFRVPDFTPLTRLNAIFDGSALAAACISSVGIAMYVVGYPSALQYILVGRAIDMIRIMRFFQIFRDIVRRTSDVTPALLGPLALVITILHAFVYIGMALWGGSVEVGLHKSEITPLYDLNNFNSYQEGIVTMFQVLVVNDWHAIAEVFLYAGRCSTPYVVYPFFILANLIGVSIVLNVLTAFFVETFVTKLNDDKDAPPEATATMHKERDFGIQHSERNGKRIASAANTSKKGVQGKDSSYDQGADADSEGSSESELYEFDVYEREGFDKIMQTVSGAYAHYEGDIARNVCNYLEIFETLSPGRETVGYLVCDQQTLERYGNRRFKFKAIGFLDENKLHGVVTDMHAELMALAPRADFRERSLLRSFPHRRDPSKKLEISASLLRRHPALSLFVSRTITSPQTVATPPLPAARNR